MTPLEVPGTLSPSKVSSFTSCALAFKFNVIDKISEPPTLPATRGTLVHSALELLFGLPAEQRTLEAALACLDVALAAMQSSPLLADLYLDDDATAAFYADSQQLVRQYFQMEDPTTVTPVGLELMVHAEIGGARVRGIIDRLELDADGGLVVTDYKTGKAPKERYEASKQVGVHLYSLLCEKMFGQRPTKIRLLYLGDSTEISTSPNDGTTRATLAKVTAIWAAIKRACDKDDFRPKPGPLCNWCPHQEICPAQRSTR